MKDELDRVNLSKAAPDLYRTVLALDQQVTERAKLAGMSVGFTNLLRLRASQINGCAFCVRLHGRDALVAGEPTDRLLMLDAWRESQYFDDEERAALALLEAVTLVDEGQVPEAVYREARATLSADKIAAIEWLAIVMAAWNRIAISSRYRVMPEGASPAGDDRSQSPQTPRP